MNKLKERVFSSLIYVVLLIGSIALGEVSSAVFFALIIILCQLEFYNLFKNGEGYISPQKITGTFGGIVLLAITFINLNYLPSLTPYLILLIVPIRLLVLELYRKEKFPAQNIATTLLGMIYIALPLTLLYRFAYFDGINYGTDYNYENLIGYFLILWSNDTGAYFVGSAFGKRPFFQRISPKKTWEGFFGGVLLGLIAGFVNSLLFTQFDLLLWLGISLIIVVFGTLGDLVESMFKRSFNKKDSGSIMPGHGGALDRFDGVLISAPVLYLFSVFMSWLSS